MDRLRIAIPGYYKVEIWVSFFEGFDDGDSARLPRVQAL